MNISQFDKQNIKALRVDIDAALKAVGTKYGIVLQAGRCKFMPKSAAFNLEASTISGYSLSIVAIEVAFFCLR